jgi:two-component system sensor histidine kinase QseC
MKRTSLQNRLIVAIGLTLAVLGALSSYVTYRLVAYRLTRAFDDTLVSKAKALLALIKQEANGHVEFEFTGTAMPEFVSKTAPEYFTLFSERGDVLARSPSLADNKPLTYSQRHFHDQRGFNLTLPDGRPGRAFALRGFPTLERDSDEEPQKPGEFTHTANPVVVVVARDRLGLDRSLVTVASALVLGSLFLTVAGALAVAIVVRRELTPLRRLAEQVEAVDVTRLDTRFAAPDLPRELAPIAERLDQLFARLREAVTRERRYTSDVAHELRTPLTEISVALEVAQRFSQLDPETQKAIQHAREAAAECRVLVETLLELARRGEATPPPPVAPVDAVKLLHEEVARFASLAKERQLTMRCTAPSDAQDLELLTNEHLLRSILRNLISNAVTYAPPQTEVTIEASRREAGQIVLSVSNIATDLSPEDVTEMCEPFWRKDAARSDRQHSGLGLTIAKSLAKLLNVELEFELAPNKVLTARIRTV